MCLEKYLSLLFSFILLSACNNSSSGGGGGTASGAGSCSLTASGFTTCYDYTGAGMTTLNAQNLCANTSSGGVTGTYSSSACPTAGRIGTCLIYGGQYSEQSIRYLNGWSEPATQTHCTNASGTYTSG